MTYLQSGKWFIWNFSAAESTYLCYRSNVFSLLFIEHNYLQSAHHKLRSVLPASLSSRHRCLLQSIINKEHHTAHLWRSPAQKELLFVFYLCRNYYFISSLLSGKSLHIVQKGGLILNKELGKKRVRKSHGGIHLIKIDIFIIFGVYWRSARSSLEQGESPLLLNRQPAGPWLLTLPNKYLVTRPFEGPREVSPPPRVVDKNGEIQGCLVLPWTTFLVLFISIKGA